MLARFGSREATPSKFGASPPDFAPPIEQLAETIARLAPPSAFLCSPNNPTGALLAASAVERLVTDAPATLFVVDEAYLPFSSGPDLVPLLEHGNLLLVRSLTKSYAIPGVPARLCACQSRVAGVLRRIAPPWSVSAPAVAAGLAALANVTWEQRGEAVARDALARLVTGLRALGLCPILGAANFVLVAVPNATEVRRTPHPPLLERGILVRDCASFGLPGYLRIAAWAARGDRPLARSLA
ncbi:MAG: hypothetical protein KatS3mg060_2749 [Dehalococcoidia bacterium]|nr:MAG: hypothetical protein KatS3mg060_2749 [Dehalococcoidia bacterium]